MTRATDSEIKDVVIEAGMMLAATGKVGHLFTDCAQGAWTHADEDADGISCVACRISRLADILEASETAMRLARESERRR